MNINKNNYEAYFLDYHEGNLSPQEVADLFLFLSLHSELKKEFDNFENIILEDFSLPVFEDKDRLKKNITADNREQYFIRAIEGTLEPAEQVLLEQFLKTYPQFLREFQLFQKTKIQSDPSIVFENKSLLKQPASVTDDQLIASLEGILTPEEQLLLHKQVAATPELQKAQKAFLATKLTADTSIIYPDKQGLKRKKKKVIPLYYYVVSAAASVILFIGLFFLFNTNTDNTALRIAEQTKQSHSKKQLVLPTVDTTVSVQHMATAGVVKSGTSTKKQTVKKAEQQQQPTVETNPLPVDTQHSLTSDPLTEQTVASNNQTEKPIVNIPVSPVDSAHLKGGKLPSIVKNETSTLLKPQEFASISDLLLGKLKNLFTDKGDATTSPDTKINSSKKINGWDVAGAVAKGLSSLTGKRIEVKPQFNEDGNLKAYALGMGKLEFSHIK
jgi:hypothetical protein